MFLCLEIRKSPVMWPTLYFQERPKWNGGLQYLFLQHNINLTIYFQIVLVVKMHKILIIIWLKERNPGHVYEYNDTKTINMNVPFQLNLYWKWSDSLQKSKQPCWYDYEKEENGILILKMHKFYVQFKNSPNK